MYYGATGEGPSVFVLVRSYLSVITFSELFSLSTKEFGLIVVKVYVLFRYEVNFPIEYPSTVSPTYTLLILLLALPTFVPFV